MSFFTRLFKRTRDTAIPDTPDEIAMHHVLQEAKRENIEAANKLSSAAGRQVRDAELIKQVVADLLDRADKRKIPDVNRKAAQ